MHLKARFSVSTGVKTEYFMRIEMKNDIGKIITVYHDKYLTAKFAFNLDKRASIDTFNRVYSQKNFSKFFLNLKFFY